MIEVDCLFFYLLLLVVVHQHLLFYGFRKILLAAVAARFVD